MSDYGLIINGDKVATEETFPVTNPATEDVVAQCPFATRDQLDAAVKAAANAFKSWSTVSDDERAAVCGKMAEAITEPGNGERLAGSWNLPRTSPCKC